ncbi:MAG: aldolase/citrate lyase family protein [Clostridiales bacterium]|nr:aldolase/citrate lyase family protein [Clostridiales bacterium]
MSKLIELKNKLKNVEPTLGTTIGNVAFSGLAQKVAACGFDFLVLDEEHGTLSAESSEEILRICRLVDLPSIVRIPDAIPNYISKILDMGADGIIIPRVERMEQVEIAITAARYYPRGRKGCGGFSNLRAEDKGNLDNYNDNRLIFIQMESYEGLQVLPEILKKYKDELAGVLIGPYDSSIMIGTPLDITSEPMTKYIRDVFDVCHQAGVSCGSFVDNAPMIARYRDLGGNVYWTGTEISLLCEAFANVVDVFKKETSEVRA